jgi:LasA protease
LRANEVQYIVQRNDTLALIARRYSVDVNTIVEKNNLTNPNLLIVGQTLVIPPPSPQFQAPDFKIIPDSELVFGPTTVGFDIHALVAGSNGYLDNYREEVEGVSLTGAQIVERISRDHSINPRLLLAVLEYQGGWVTQRTPPDNRIDYPLGFLDRNRKGLYKQLFWAANNLNLGFYAWQTDSLPAFVLADSSMAPASPLVNSGTAAVQYLMGLLYNQGAWKTAIGSQGLFATFASLFGNPFDLTFEPLVPPSLKQPPLQLPFEKGVLWYFTGGPHMGWDTGSAPAALDFAPVDAGACNVSSAWEVAVADGKIVRAGNGSVILDLDGDGNEQTGWTILYLHVASQDRVAVGQVVKAGDPIGHPSCEGGYATVTHLHLARRYNGYWIPAGGTIPFTMDGWAAESVGIEYDGFLNRKGESIEAWNSRTDQNQIQR